MQKVAVVMGSTSDWPTMQQVTAQLTSLAIPYEEAGYFGSSDARRAGGFW